MKEISDKSIKCILLFAIVMMFFFTGYSKADAVSDWNEIANKVFLKALRPGGAAIVDMAYMHIAIFDAVNSIDKKYTVFAVESQNDVPWASKEAAAISAAYRVLVTFYPDQQAFLDSAYNAELNEVSSGGAKIFGISIGNEVALKFLATREGDGRNANVSYTFGSGAGVYQLTPGAPAPPATPQSPWLAHLKPFVMDSTSQFRAPAPPSLTSDIYTRDFNESSQYGCLNNSLRTSEMTQCGMFYAENPGNQLSRNIRLLASEHGFSLIENARFFAQLYVTIADAVIATWESKFFYNRWRPVTAIRNADSDNNPLTIQDTSWLPLVVTPGHPEYPGAHGAVTGSLAYALERIFGTSTVNVNLTSTTVPGKPMTMREFTDTKDIVTDVINGRVYGGMHFRTSVEAGAAIAFNVANWVADHKFKSLETASLIPTDHLQLWVMPDTGIILNDSTVSRWIDQSGNGNDAIQSDTSRQPRFVGSGLNHKPVLEFDGVNDRLGLTGSKLITQITLFIVEKPMQGATVGLPYYPLVFGDSGSNDFGISMLNKFSDPPNSPDEIDPWTNDQSWVRAKATGISALDQWKILSVTANKTIFNTTLRSNGIDAVIVPQGIDASLNFPLGNSTGTGHGGIGGADGEPEHLIFKGDIAEVIVYDTVLSKNDRLAIEQYLSNKYLVKITTDVTENISVPDKYSLEQNYPNPFNPSTTIRYSITQSGPVKIAVYNSLGQKVKELVNEVKEAGSYDISFNAASLASGIYFYKIETEQFTQTKKMILLK